MFKVYALLTLAAAAAVAGTPAQPAQLSREERLEAVCRESAGYEAMRADYARSGQGQDGELLDALVRVRMDRAMAKYGVADDGEQRQAVEIVCRYYTKGALNVIEGLARDMLPRPEAAPVAAGGTAR